MTVYTPYPKVIFAGVNEYADNTISNISISLGRRDIYEQALVGIANVRRFFVAAVFAEVLLHAGVIAILVGHSVFRGPNRKGEVGAFFAFVECVFVNFRDVNFDADWFHVSIGGCGFGAGKAWSLGHLSPTDGDRTGFGCLLAFRDLLIHAQVIPARRGECLLDNKIKLVPAPSFMNVVRVDKVNVNVDENIGVVVH